MVFNISRIKNEIMNILQLNVFCHSPEKFPPTAHYRTIVRQQVPLCRERLQWLLSFVHSWFNKSYKIAVCIVTDALAIRGSDICDFAESGMTDAGYDYSPNRDFQDSGILKMSHLQSWSSSNPVNPGSDRGKKKMFRVSSLSIDNRHSSRKRRHGSVKYSLFKSIQDFIGKRLEKFGRNPEFSFGRTGFSGRSRLNNRQNSCHGPAMAGDDDLLTLFNGCNQLQKICLCFADVYLEHGIHVGAYTVTPVKWTMRSL